ncbi:MAG: energy-coupling factor transporter transmembrane component T family protein, partial [Halobacteriota archaeon]
MLGYVPGETIGHRLDPRSKLAFQLAFAAVAFAHTSPTGLASLTVLALLVAVGSGLSILRAILSVRILAPFLVGAPIVAALTFGPPWIDPTAAIDPALASYRVVLIVLVSAAYVRTTPVRDSRAAIQRTIPGRFGVLLGVGVSLVFRFLPALRRELRSIRSAEVARLGSARSVGDRIGLL